MRILAKVEKGTFIYQGSSRAVSGRDCCSGVRVEGEDQRAASDLARSREFILYDSGRQWTSCFGCQPDSRHRGALVRVGDTSGKTSPSAGRATRSSIVRTQDTLRICSACLCGLLQQSRRCERWRAGALTACGFDAILTTRGCRVIAHGVEDWPTLPQRL